MLAAPDGRVSLPVGTVAGVTTSALTSQELRRMVAEALEPHDMSVDEFLGSDVDDLEADELRDLWLMVKGALPAA